MKGFLGVLSTVSHPACLRMSNPTYILVGFSIIAVTFDQCNFIFKKQLSTFSKFQWQIQNLKTKFHRNKITHVYPYLEEVHGHSAKKVEPAKWRETCKFINVFHQRFFLMNMNASGTNDPPLERGDAGEQFRLQVAVEDVYH